MHEKLWIDVLHKNGCGFFVHFSEFLSCGFMFCTNFQGKFRAIFRLARRGQMLLCLFCRKGMAVLTLPGTGRAKHLRRGRATSTRPGEHLGAEAVRVHGKQPAKNIIRRFLIQFYIL